MKIRADQLLVKKGLVPSRHQAQSLILAGKVFFSKGRVEKAGQLIDEGEELKIEEALQYVGRGGIKLDHALEEFKVEAKDKICLDIGVSTGGFTDCLLQREVKKVYAVDVGYGQVHWKIRQDSRVVILERTNFRYLSTDKVPEKIALTVIDVSFISLEKILPKLLNFLKPDAEVVALVKPQFELSPAEVKTGVVRSEALREKAVMKISNEAKRLGYRVKGERKSPIEGAKGNQEFFLYLWGPPKK